MDTLDTRNEQAHLRWRGCYLYTKRGTPIYVDDIWWEPVDEEDPEGECVLKVRGTTTSGRHQPYSEDDLVWEVWPKHHVLFSPEWGGVVVWEKSGQRQIKKGPSNTSFQIVGGRYTRNPLGIAQGWYHLMNAMRSAVYYDVPTARAMLTDDSGLQAVPISPNAYITREDTIYYHNRPLGRLEDAMQHRLWHIINKESGGVL